MTGLDPRFRDNVPAIVTPCNRDGTPDLQGIRRLVEHVIAAGSDAIVMLGTTGEFSLVPPEFRASIIRAGVEAAKGRVPVMVGCGRPSVAETVAEIAEAAACGAVAAMVTPSYYFPLAEEEIVTFFTAAAASAPIPLLYYHYPEMTKNKVTVPTIAKLVAKGLVAGIKDSSSDAAFFARLTAALGGRDDFRIFIGGSGYLLAALELGAHGVTGALSNFGAHLDRAVLDAFRAGDLPRARQAQSDIVRAVDAIFHGVPKNAAAITKFILSELGVCDEAVFEPVALLTDAEKSALRAKLPSLGIGGTR